MQRSILSELKRQSFASTNVVMGLGSFGFQYKTRDSLGWAVKCTYAETNGSGYNIFKNPKTDDGTKKSAQGLLRVNADMSVSENCTWEQESEGLLETVFLNGKLIREHSLTEIRQRVQENV